MSLPRHDWYLPVKIHLGAGLLSLYQPTGPVVVLADVHAVPTDLRTALQDRWQSQGLTWVWQTRNECEVSHLWSLAQPLWQAMDEAQDAQLLAIGGGTTLDMAKILRWRPRHSVSESDTLQLWRSQGHLLTGDLVRHTLICWPSTAGTGSEVSASATLWDRSSVVPQKLAWQPPQGHADEAWVDPVLTLTCPAKVTRDCALDALAHALESLWNVRANAMTRPLAYRAVHLLMTHLPVVLAQGHDLSARSALSEAALLAGMAMAQTQTALAHALSYDVTLREGVAHGEAVAMWLPFVTNLACLADASLRAQLQELFGTPSEPAEYLRHWLEGLGIITRGLEDLPGGQAAVFRALQSPRGQNQIQGAPHGF